MSEQEKFFEVPFLFNYRCVTRGTGFPAKSLEEALEKARQCITPEGYLDDEKYKELGGAQNTSWDNQYAIDDSYEVDEDGADLAFDAAEEEDA